MKSKVGFSLLFAVIACLFTWLVTGELSPFHDYFLNHTALPNTVLKLLVIPYLATVMINPETDFGDMAVAVVVEFAQWLIIGFLLASVFRAVFARRESKSDSIT